MSTYLVDTFVFIDVLRGAPHRAEQEKAKDFPMRDLRLGRLEE